MDICEWRGGALGKAAVVRGMLEVPNPCARGLFRHPIRCERLDCIGGYTLSG